MKSLFWWNCSSSKNHLISKQSFFEIHHRQDLTKLATSFEEESRHEPYRLISNEELNGHTEPTRWSLKTETYGETPPPSCSWKDHHGENVSRVAFHSEYHPSTDGFKGQCDQNDRDDSLNPLFKLRIMSCSEVWKRVCGCVGGLKGSKQLNYGPWNDKYFHTQKI